MDAFFAAVEVRDDPSLRGKPLIIGSLPHERGVVATCSYEARPCGVRSGMNIKDAYRLCPQGVYMHPNFEKYRAVSALLRKIWYDYAVKMEPIALDEAYLDVTYSAGDFERAGEMARGPRMAPDLYMERHGGAHVYMKPGVDSPQDIASRAFEAGLNAAEHGVGLGR